MIASVSSAAPDSRAFWSLSTNRSTYGVCSGPNPFSKSVQDGMLAFVGEGALKGWNKHAHPAKAGFTPLEVFE